MPTPPKKCPLCGALPVWESTFSQIFSRQVFWLKCPNEDSLLDWGHTKEETTIRWNRHVAFIELEMECEG